MTGILETRTNARTGRHRRAVTPREQWNIWNISFLDTDDENTN